MKLIILTSQKYRIVWTYVGFTFCFILAVILWRGSSVDPRYCFIFPPCPFHLLTGLYCPGCGSTRASFEFIHGHWIAAFKLNPFMILSLPVIFGLVLFECFTATSNKLRLIPTSWIKTYFFLLLLFWILRNIPYYPLNLLAPH